MGWELGWGPTQIEKKTRHEHEHGGGQCPPPRLLPQALLPAGSSCLCWRVLACAGMLVCWRAEMPERHTYWHRHWGWCRVWRLCFVTGMGQKQGRHRNKHAQSEWSAGKAAHQGCEVVGGVGVEEHMLASSRPARRWCAKVEGELQCGMLPPLATYDKAASVSVE